MTLHEPPAGQSARATAQVLEAVSFQESVTVFQQMADVSLCLRFSLPMSASMTASIVLIAGVMM